MKLNIGDLFVDEKEVKSGILIEILKKHIKISWGDIVTKISKWEIQNRVFVKKTIQYFPVKRNKPTKK